MRGLDPHIDQAVGKARRRTFRDWDVHRLHVRTAADHLPGLAARALEQDRQGAADAACVEGLGLRGEELLQPGEPLCLHRLRKLAILRSEEHTSELQSLMRISYAVFCLKNKTLALVSIRTTNTPL